jgi:hypothetical protein
MVGRLKRHVHVIYNSCHCAKMTQRTFCSLFVTLIADADGGLIVALLSAMHIILDYTDHLFN